MLVKLSFMTNWILQKDYEYIHYKFVVLRDIINDLYCVINYNSDRYEDNSIGSCFIGVGLYIVNNGKKIKNLNYVRMFDLGFGQGFGDERKLDDTHEILEHYNIKMIKDIGRMD